MENLGGECGDRDALLVGLVTVRLAQCVNYYARTPSSLPQRTVA